MHILEVQDGIVATLHDFVPQDDLVQVIVLRLVFGSKIQEQLLHVPIEQRIQVSAEIECEMTQVPFLPVGAVVRNILPENRSRNRLSSVCGSF